MKLKWGDFLVFFVIASVIVLMFILSAPDNSSEALTALIIKDGEVLHEVSLSDVSGQKEYLLDDGDVTIIAEQGRIKFLESDCKNQICVYTGWINHSNEIAACLPNRILIKIVGTQNDVDVVVR